MEKLVAAASFSETRATSSASGNIGTFDNSFDSFRFRVKKSDAPFSLADDALQSQAEVVEGRSKVVLKSFFTEVACSTCDPVGGCASTLSEVMTELFLSGSSCDGSRSDLGPIEERILRDRFVFLLSLVDRVAPWFVVSGDDNKHSLNVNAVVSNPLTYLTCLLDHVFSFLFAHSDSAACWGKPLELLFHVAARRGLVATVVERILAATCPSDDIFDVVMRSAVDGACRDRRLTQMLGCCIQCCFSLKARDVASGNTARFCRFVQGALFHSGVAGPCALCADEGDEARCGIRRPQFETLLKALCDIFSRGCATAAFIASPTTGTNDNRLVVHRLFSELIFTRSRDRPWCDGCVSKVYGRLIDCILQSWALKDLDVVPLAFNEAIGHAVTYLLVFSKEPSLGVTLFDEGSGLASLLNGISSRFDNLRHKTLRRDGARVAALYSDLYVAPMMEDKGASLPPFDEFPNVLAEWLAWGAGSDVMLPHRDSDVTNTEQAPRVVSRRQLTVAISVHFDDDEGNPDARARFFAIPVNSKKSTPLAQRREGGPSAASRSFGKTTFDGDGAQQLFVHFSDVYAALCVKGSNESEHETSRKLLQSIQSIPKLLQRVFKSQQAQQQGTEKITSSVTESAGDAPMIASTLLVGVVQALCCADCGTIPAEALPLKFESIVWCIVVSPRPVLRFLQTLLFSSAMALAVRVELFKAVSEAARLLSEVPSCSEVSSEPETNAKHRRRYPPIGRQSTVPSNTVPDCSKKTRRWGYAKRDRAPTRKAVTYRNLVHDYLADLLTCLLGKHDTDHFAFDDSYTPFAQIELLKAVQVVITCAGRYSSWATRQWCSMLYPFLVKGVTHATGEVRAQAWLTTGEVMKCWARRGDGQTLTDEEADEFVAVQRHLHKVFRNECDPLVRDVSLHVFAEFAAVQEC